MILLKEMGIGTQVHYRPIPQQPYYANLGYDFADYPEALHYYEEALSIPLFPKVKRSQQEYVAKSILALLED